MLPKKLIQLSKGKYEKVEQIGYGATSKVYLVTPSPQHNQIFHLLPAQSTNLKTNSSTQTPQVLQEFNPDLEKFDLLIKQNHQSPNQPQNLNQHSSFSLEHGKQIKDSPYTIREYYALKIIQINKIPDSLYRERQYVNEIRMLSLLSHPGVIKILDSKIIQKPNKKQLLILEQLGVRGNFLKFMDFIEEGDFSDGQKQIVHKYYIAQIIQIVHFLQRQCVSHLDIKAQNFILDEDYRLKLIDFGVSEHFSTNNQPQQNNHFPTIELKSNGMYVGTLSYISPEMIDRTRNRKTNKRSYYSKADIWSIGVLIYYIITSQYPFSGANTYNTLEDIQKNQPNFHIIHNKDLCELIQKILVKNPNQRIGIDQIKESKYFDGFDFANVFNIQSPIVKMLEEREKEEPEEYLFKEKGVVTINDKKRRRWVILSKKTVNKKIVHHQSILEKANSFSNINIKKNNSQNTQFLSDNKIDSSNSLNSSTSIKSIKIQRIGLKIPPQYFEILPSTALTFDKEVCRLQWPQKTKKSKYKDGPQIIRITFEKQQILQRFIDCFKKIKEQSQNS